MSSRDKVKKLEQLAAEILDEAEKRGFTVEETELIPEAVERALKHERRGNGKLYKRERRFYFTFGSDKQFPYGRGQYVVVKAQDIREAARKYKRKYPNPHDDEVLNCADYYSQQAWDERIKQYYGGTEPAEIIE